MSQNDSQVDKIIRQVEYYFGDVNLSKDKFLQEETQKDSGWVTLETLLKFNRLKQLTTEAQVVIDALKKSTSDLLEIDEENKKIRRARPLPENLSEFETNLKQNTVYVKGFPGSLTLDDLFGFFESHGKILQIFMRRFPGTKQFKGSVFVTFETAEQMKTFLELPELKYKDELLLRESQAAYLERKAPQIEKIKESKKRKEQQKEDKEKQKRETEEAYIRDQKVSGAILHLKALGAGSTRENIKELFDTFAKVRYIDFAIGQTEAYVRFQEAGKAKEALEKALAKAPDGGPLELKGVKVEAKVLEGEEEEEYWKKIVQKLTESRNAKGHKKHNRRHGKGDHKRNNGNKRSHDDDDDDDDDNDKDGNEENKNGAKKADDDAGEKKPVVAVKSEEVDEGEKNKKLKVN